MNLFNVGWRSPRTAGMIRRLLAWFGAFSICLIGAPVASAVTFSEAPGSPFATGTFGFPAGAPTAVVIADFNADGRPDLGVMSQGAKMVDVLLARADGTFEAQPPFSFSTTGLPYGLAVADFNRDGRPDMAVADWGCAYGCSGQDPGNNVAVLLSDGAGGFTAAPGSPFETGGASPNSIAAGDFNGDGIGDVAVTNINSGDVSVLLGDGTGRLIPAAGSPVGVGFILHSIAVGDFNGDGKQDLAIAAGGWVDGVSVLLGNGAGQFVETAGSPVKTGGENPAGVAVGDLNGDGRQDLVVSNADTSDLSVLLGSGNGAFTPASGSPFAAARALAGGISVADFNADGKQDVAVGGWGVLLGNGAGGLSTASGAPFPTGAFAAGDLNGDDKPDVAVANHDAANVAVWLNVIALASVSTGGASAVGLTTAILNGTVDPRDPDIAASYHFEYGMSAAYGSTVPGSDAAVGSAAGGHSVSQALAGLQPATTYHYRIVASNAAGSSYGQDQTFTTLAAATNPSTVDRIPPRLSGLRISPASFRAERRGPSLLLSGRRGTKVTYRLSEPATIAFTIAQARPGSKSKRYVLLAGSFKQDARAGLNTFRFTGRLRNATLKPGTYRLIAVARDPAGNLSAPVHCSFTLRR